MANKSISHVTSALGKIHRNIYCEIYNIPMPFKQKYSSGVLHLHHREPIWTKHRWLTLFTRWMIRDPLGRESFLLIVEQGPENCIRNEAEHDLKPSNSVYQ